MPNITTCRLIITGNKRSLAAFKRRASAGESEGFQMSNFIPPPKELRNIATGGRRIGHHYVDRWLVKDGKEYYIPPERLRQLEQKYGACSRHDWQCQNYGTKWDVCGPQTMPAPLTYEFDSAWCWPAAGISAISKMYSSLTFTVIYEDEDYDGTHTVEIKRGRIRELACAHGDDQEPEDCSPEDLAKLAA